MAKIIEKRRSLHNNIKKQQEKNNKLQLQLSQLHALANIGANWAMVAHEINNILTPLKNYSQLALMHPEDDKLCKKALEKSVLNSDRISNISKSILAVINGEANEKRCVNLRQTIDEIFSCLCRDFSKDSITVNIDIPENLSLFVVPIEIQQVFMNLILNARDAMLSSGGTLDIKAIDSGDTIQVDISDTGCGIDAENIDKIFDLLFTTKNNDGQSSQTSGSGLGLSFCKKAVENNDGDISVNSIQGQGTTFAIQFPKPKQVDT